MRSNSAIERLDERIETATAYPRQLASPSPFTIRKVEIVRSKISPVSGGQ